MTGIKRIYLDVCTICRPFDNQDLIRIRMETDAYFLIMNAVQSKNYQLQISPVHFTEVNAISDLYEGMKVIEILKTYGVQSKFNKTEALDRANELTANNFGIADAAHLAIAEQISDCFISCDDKLIKKYKKLQTVIHAVNPIQFCLEENLK